MASGRRGRDDVKEELPLFQMLRESLMVMESSKSLKSSPSEGEASPEYGLAVMGGRRIEIQLKKRQKKTLQSPSSEFSFRTLPLV
ncbi:hypothetical protein SAY87_009090 [Trapa incisa]|uniref:Uncharacterized protein n=1 Tax=Trapa incisa TaxID=236973 RepID=A0AAN7K164_9MYRT|nr:hypothetical protein SAY87_009090 [Trapa incisa]